MQESWETRLVHGMGTKPFHPEDDEWDGVSILELPPKEDKEQKWKVFGEDGLRCVFLVRPWLSTRHWGRAAPPAPGQPRWEPRPSTGRLHHPMHKLNKTLLYFYSFFFILPRLDLFSLHQISHKWLKSGIPLTPLKNKTTSKLIWRCRQEKNLNKWLTETTSKREKLF